MALLRLQCDGVTGAGAGAAAARAPRVSGASDVNRDGVQAREQAEQWREHHQLLAHTMRLRSSSINNEHRRLCRCTAT